MAHRGFHPSGIDENSSAALRRAAERGFSVEFDVWSDADDRLWVFHDRDTQRATGESHLIDQLTSAQVRDLRYTKAGSRLAPFAKAARRILLAHPGTPAYIEPKQAAIADDVVHEIVSAERVKSTWITAYGDVVHDRWPRVHLLEKSGSEPPAPADLVDRGVDIVSLFAGQTTTAVIRDYHAAGIDVKGASPTRPPPGTGRSGPGRTARSPTGRAPWCGAARPADLRGGRCASPRRRPLAVP